MITANETKQLTQKAELNKYDNLISDQLKAIEVDIRDAASKGLSHTRFSFHNKVISPELLEAVVCKLKQCGYNVEYNYDCWNGLTCEYCSGRIEISW